MLCYADSPRHPPAVDRKFRRSHASSRGLIALWTKRQKIFRRYPTSVVASLHGDAVRHPTGDSSVHGSSRRLGGCVRATDSISEPAVPAYLQWCSWLVILMVFFGVFGVARDKH